MCITRRHIDHQLLKFNFNCYADCTGTQQRFNYNSGEYEDVRHKLQEVPITVNDSVVYWFTQ